MDETLITSTANPLIKGIRALRQRKFREERSAFFVEGIRPVWEAIASGAEVETIVLAPELMTSDAARQMIKGQEAAGTVVVRVSSKVFESVAERENPSGLGAVVRTSRRPLDRLGIRPSSVFVALDEAGNPGNIGTVIRTMDAVGGNGLILVGNTADPYHPAAIKASMGTLFSMPVVQVAKIEDVLKWCDLHGVTVVTTSPRAPATFWSVQYSFPAMFVFGNEGEGLAEETLERGGTAVRIPMAGTADSLNLAVSVGVLLYEVERQRSGFPESLRVES